MMDTGLLTKLVAKMADAAQVKEGILAINVILQDSSVNFNRVDMGLLSKAAVNIEGIVQEGVRLSWGREY